MNFYLNKYGFQSPKITVLPNSNLNIIIVIPCFNEPDLIRSLTAVLNCESPTCNVEVITVINAGINQSEEIKEKNRVTYKKAKKWADENNSDGLEFYFLEEENLPRKHAGVGLARKIGMDEAVARFHTLDKDGIIVCFDADSLCEKNYLVEIEKHFIEHPKTPGCSIHFEHPIAGNEFSEEIYQGIINYELHLRYYNQCLVYANLPYAYHTVGSSMAVLSSAYQKQGGMNKRKAGEDFYFIHKIIALGNFTELKTTKVIPSPRISDRVPFGTGKAIGDWIETGQEIFQTYAFSSFEIIKAFVKIIPKLQNNEIYSIDLALSDTDKKLLFDFLEEQKFNEAITEIIKNSKGISAFKKRFFRWFDAFKVLKLVHYLRDNGIPRNPIEQEVVKLLKKSNRKTYPTTARTQLIRLREIESN